MARSARLDRAALWRRPRCDRRTLGPRIGLWHGHWRQGRALSGARGGLFRDELIDALVILEQGHVARAEMKGSWAGAMGQAQFMPSSFLKYATAFDGGAHKDIWTNRPDVLAS